jgi:protein MAK16
VSRKATKREKSRLVKAEKAALIDKQIEEELLKNLQKGKYPIYNYPQKNWNNILDKQEVELEEEDVRINFLIF